MTDAEWLACNDPDLLLEAVEGKVPRERLVEWVRLCWKRITPPVHSDVTVVDQFAALAPTQSDHDAVIYASEATLKAAGWAPHLADERKAQAALLRQVVGRRPV